MASAGVSTGWNWWTDVIGCAACSSCVRLEPHDRVVAVAEEGLVEEPRVLARARVGELLVEALRRWFEGAHAYADKALDLEVEAEELGRDRSNVARVEPERVAGDAEARGVRRHEHDRRARRERAPQTAQEGDEVAGQDVLGDVTRVRTVDRLSRERLDVRDRVGLERLEPALAALGDHERVEVDAVAADSAVAQQLKEHAATAPEIEHAAAAGEEIDELLRLLTDDAFVAAEARLEVDGMKIRCDLVLAELLPLALETREALAEARREPPLDVVRRGEEAVDALLPIADR